MVYFHEEPGDPILLINGTLMITDSDSTDLQSATVIILNRMVGDILSVSIPENLRLSANYSGNSSFDFILIQVYTGNPPKAAPIGRMILCRFSEVAATRKLLVYTLNILFKS